MNAVGVKGPQLAQLAGTTKQQISKLRRGERRMTVEWARRLACHLGIGWKELIEEQQTEQSRDEQKQADQLKRQSCAFDVLDERTREALLRLSRNIARREQPHNNLQAIEAYAKPYAAGFAASLVGVHSELNALREECDKLKSAMEQIRKIASGYVGPTSEAEFKRPQLQSSRTKTGHISSINVLSEPRKATEFSLLVKREATRLLKTSMQADVPMHRNK